MRKYRKKLFLLLFIIVTLISTVCSQEDIEPPKAKKVPYSETHHGIVIQDDYHWMVDPEGKDPEIIEYINAENAYTEKKTEHLKDFQEKLFREMISKVKETDTSLPVKIDNYYYYSKSEKGKQYGKMYRKKIGLFSREEMYLDIDELAKGHDYFALGELKISRNHRYLAYSYDTKGSEFYTLVIKDLETGKLFPEQIYNTRIVAWANDNKTLFYTAPNDTGVSHRVYKHILNTEPSSDVIIFEENNPSAYVSIWKSRDKDYLFINTGSDNSNEIRYIKGGEPDSDWKIFSPRGLDYTYYPIPHEGKFFVVTDKDNAKNNKVMMTPKDKTGVEDWQEYIPHRENVLIGVDVFKDYLILYEQIRGIWKMKVINFGTGKSCYVDFPEEIYSLGGGSNYDYDTDIYQFTYTSMTTPWMVIEYNMKTGKQKIKKEQEIPGGYNRKLYETKCIYAKSQDGAEVPITLVYKKSLFKKDGSNPLLLSSYGAFGISQEPMFSTVSLTLLDRGFVIALAHIRGGSELGEEWHEGGMLLNKKNSFYDFIACEEHLINEKYTSSDRLVIEGGSAGGMLMGAVVNIRPDLPKIVILEIPYIDYLNSMLYPNLYGVINYYDEWGNPYEKEYFDYIMSYCPYQNLEAKDYPIMIVTASYNDARVKYWSPLKYVAKLRTLRTDNNLFLLKMEIVQGHLGTSGRYDAYKNIAFIYAFILDSLGIKE